MISGGTVIAMDPERRVIRGGSVGIDGDRIAWVGHAGQEPPAARRTIDAAGHYVLPGIVDTHGHAGHSLTRGLGEGRPEVGTAAEPGWGDIVGSIYFHASDEEFWRAESRLAALERLKFGVTTSVSMTGSSPRVDDPRYALAAASGYDDLGLRHIAAAGPPNGPWPRTYTDRSGVGCAPRSVRRSGPGAGCHRGVHSGVCAGAGADRRPDLVLVGPSAVSPSTDAHDPFTREQVSGVKRLVERYGVGFHSHAYRGMVRAAFAIEPELLGPHATLAHCAGIEPDEIEILARTGHLPATGR